MKKIFLPFLFLAFSLQTSDAQNCLPELTVINGLAVNVGPVDTDGNETSDVVGVTLYASDFLVDARSPCGNDPLEITITKETQLSPGNSDEVFFNLTELGTQIVRIWATDAAGNFTYVETYVLIQDNQNWESQGPVSTACDPDLVPPTLVVLNGLASTFIPDGNGSAVVRLKSVQMTRRFSDNCGAAAARPRINKSTEFTGAPPTTGFSTFVCNDELGFSIVQCWAKDGAGNYALTESYIMNQDGVTDYCENNITNSCNPDLMPPTMFVFNGVAVNINTPGAREVYAAELISYISDHCGLTADARIRLSNGSNVPPTTTKVTFDCSSLGTQPVDIWIADQAGNWIRTQTYVFVQDNIGGCGNAPRPAGRESKPWPEWKETQGVIKGQ